MASPFNYGLYFAAYEPFKVNRRRHVAAPNLLLPIRWFEPPHVLGRLKRARLPS